MNLSDIPDRVGYREFKCCECEKVYMLLGRDRFSPSSDECPACRSYTHPHARWSLGEIVGRLGELAKQGVIPIAPKRG